MDKFTARTSKTGRLAGLTTEDKAIIDGLKIRSSVVGFGSGYESAEDLSREMVRDRAFHVEPLTGPFASFRELAENHARNN